MRTARMNGAILGLCCIAFILQSVGYLAPAWFVREFTVQHGTEGFMADGKRFRLLQSAPMNPDMWTKQPPSYPNMDNGNRNKRSILLDGDSSHVDEHNPDGDGPSVSIHTFPILHNNPRPGSTGAGDVAPNNQPAIMPFPDLHSTGENEKEKEILPNSNQDEETSEKDNLETDPAAAGGSNGADSIGKTNKNKNTGNLVMPTNGADGRNKNKIAQSNSDVDDGDDSKDNKNTGNTQLKDNDIDTVSDQDDSINPPFHDAILDFIDQIGEDSTNVPRPTFGNDFIDNTHNGGGQLPSFPLQPHPWGNGNDGDFNSDVDFPLYPNFDPNNFPQTSDMDRINENTFHDVQNMFGTNFTPPPNMRKAMQQARVMEKLVTGHRILHVTAGLWYGRACVNSHDFLTSSGDKSGTEWCTLYIRTKEYALNNQKNIFEFRIEASLGLGFCLLGLLVASTTCCSTRKQGTRIVMTLVCLFVSGAVMLIPVIHIIVQHHNVNGVFHRSRDWSRFMVHTYLRHDLFDHWSVILCGCGSLLSVLGSTIFAILGCRHQKQSDTKYDLSKSETGEIRKELPVNWARNNKITIPTSKMSICTTPESLEGYDSDYHTETRDEDVSSLGYHNGDPAAKDDVMNDTASGSDVKSCVQTGQDTMADEENETDFLEGVDLDDD